MSFTCAATGYLYRMTNENVYKKTADGVRWYQLKDRKPAYITVVVVLLLLASIYLIRVYRNKHELQPSPKPATVGNPYKTDQKQVK